VVDRDTLSKEDLQKIVTFVRYRPMQLAMFLTALLGADGMEALMSEAIAAAKNSAALSGPEDEPR
jgi:hypothetical protein